MEVTDDFQLSAPAAMVVDVRIVPAGRGPGAIPGLRAGGSFTLIVRCGCLAAFASVACGVFVRRAFEKAFSV